MFVKKQKCKGKIFKGGGTKMYKIEYEVTIGDKNYSFYVSNESLTILKRNTKKDILYFVKQKGLPAGNCEVEMTILYNEEYYDSDYFELVISDDYADAELVA